MEGYQAGREKCSFQMETGTHFVSCSIIKWLSNLKCLAIDIRLLAQKLVWALKLQNVFLNKTVYLLFQSTQQKKGYSCNGSYLAIEWCLANGVSHSLHITETVHKHWPYEMNYVILKRIQLNSVGGLKL